SLIAKPKVSSRVLERKHAWVTFTQPRASLPRTRQTTISAFFGTQTDEKDKENSSPSPFIPKRDCKDKGVSLPVYPVKILALPRVEGAQQQSCRAQEEGAQQQSCRAQEEGAQQQSCRAQEEGAQQQSCRAQEETVPVTAQRCPPKPPASPTPGPESSLLQVESHSESEGSCGAGEDCCSFSFTQDSEGNRIIAHRNGSDLFASSSVTSDRGINRREGRLHLEEVKTGLDFQPRFGAKQNKKRQQSSSVNSVIDFSDTENINPAVRRDSTWAVGFCSPPQSPAGARPLRERSQNAGAAAAEEGRGSTRGLSSPCRDLFTQDSEGNRVIAHRCPHVPSPRKDGGSSGRRLPKGSPSAAASRSLSKAGEQVDVCCELLFTQDSEGNRVIKHW
ncbi:uncharacterized protein LOC114818281, partial [Antrostomus carolinensis]|uniref:uncharacterized protein LOC114818281 n=1 Tax=Antrostomus carolinensis TaxID=279965 RepID=UPI0010A989B4